MVTYKELGFKNTEKMFKVALKRKFAIPGYNINNLEQLQAIINGCGKSESPVIIQISKGARSYANEIMLRYLGQGGVKMAKSLGFDIPIALHLDHGDSYELCKSCIDSGFSSVMYDGSHLNYEENVKITKRVVDYAHQKDVSVEAELGVLAGIEEHVEATEHEYTDPEMVKDFVERTGCDSLAIAIGTSHGAYKFKVDKAEDIPELRFDILKEVKKRLGDYPIVLHGSSSVLREYVAIINEYGGSLKKAFGIPEEQLRKATKYGVSKINIDTDGRLVFTAMIRKNLFENPEVFDPRKYLGPAREELIKMIMRKNEEVLGSANQAKYF
ncbi:MAG: class II fructose-1,6-bisphosphate aldolase [Candidatus Lokiarchaeota archaeon]|nr:class II fructose-1,6-bisphosphate aldolase [Candidatus Lokiarchaeota archaeon]MBD3198582.1 class II fructose-1,6-bisphosphate aldolase [Candidatus Lokiarchaeota archaeon]